MSGVTAAQREFPFAGEEIVRSAFCTESIAKYNCVFITYDSATDKRIEVTQSNGANDAGWYGIAIEAGSAGDMIRVMVRGRTKCYDGTNGTDLSGVSNLDVGEPITGAAAGAFDLYDNVNDRCIGFVLDETNDVIFINGLQ